MKVYQLTIFCACMFMAFASSARSLEIEQVEALCACVNGYDGVNDVGEFNTYQTGLFVYVTPLSLSTIDCMPMQSTMGGGRKKTPIRPTSIGSGDKYTACGREVSSNESCLIGDVDMDGVVHIKDVSSLVDYLNNCGNEMRDPFSIQAADVNGDGMISIGDVSALIDKLLVQK